MDFTDLHALLHATYGEMMPLCAHMTGIAKGIAGRVNMSNLCSEILQVNSPSTYPRGAITSMSSSRQ